MTCHIEKVSTETLDLILQHFSGSPTDLQQFKRVNRRWQQISEKYIYKKLTFQLKRKPKLARPSFLGNEPVARRGGPHASEKHVDMTAVYGQFLLEPRRAGYVKTLRISEPFLRALRSGLFNMFPNIERVVFIAEPADQPIDWKLIRETFTPERCRLKQLPYSESGDALSNYRKPPRRLEEYVAMIHDHCDTLEKVDLTAPEEKWNETIEAFGNGRSFPNVKRSHIRMCFEDLELANRLIDKFPQLQEIQMHYFQAENRPVDSFAVTSLQRVTKVNVSHANTGIPNLFSFLTAKFPNTQDWRIYPHCADHELSKTNYTIDSLQDIAVPLRLITKAKKSSVSFLTCISSIPEALRIFLASKNINKSVYIFYQDPRDDYLRQDFKLQGKRTDIASIISSSTHYQQNSSYAVKIQYNVDGLSHLSLLEREGALLHHLSLGMPKREYFDIETEQNTLVFLRGGALAHLINHCPALESVAYTGEALESIDPVSALSTNTSLKKMKLNIGEAVQSNILLNISRSVPKLKELHLSCPFAKEKITMTTKAQVYGKSVNKEVTATIRRMTIDMAETDFELLTLGETHGGKGSGLHDNQEVVLVQIELPGKPVDKHYLRPYREQKPKYDEYGEEVKDYNQKPESISLGKAPHIEIIIYCKSIKHLKYVSLCCGEIKVDF